MPTVAEARALIERACAELPLDHTGPTSYVVTLPGTHKLKTNVNLIVGEQALRIEAFVVRQPDENREAVWAWLLRRNAKLYGVAFTIDAVGDVYLTGRLPLAALTEEELDRLLGAVLSAADDSFDTLLELGFSTAIKREWQWRVSRGEPTDNLRAFQHLFTSGETTPPEPAAS
ncbi:YbjN domain-containing protein [Catellatospora sp. KI3]|uniref:YbjN domain-containing protein n=1 Tax=Catellatospora sp. KI3 TaxID=3041620 RepID=UPI00248243B6|nr:YbjN domain-containing protein [Catellatospora sp. KI3]MDI1460103.1 YbjN domain-containing protein [Catellatospora sp. KI3]